MPKPSKRVDSDLSAAESRHKSSSDAFLAVLIAQARATEILGADAAREALDSLKHLPARTDRSKGKKTAERRRRVKGRKKPA